MNILFLSYWAAHDGLTKSTVIPHIEMLSEMDGIEKVIFCSIERTKDLQTELLHMPRVIHFPLFSGTTYFHKILDFLIIPRKLIALVRHHKVNMLICRGAPAGALGYLVNRRVSTPYIVESFEPHASYMVESGVWKKGGLKDRSQTHWEQKQLATAKWIVTVSKNYRDYLAGTGAIRGRLAVAPCAVDFKKFSLSMPVRIRLRHQLGFADSSIVGVYVGKFGGLYLEDEAFDIFAEAFNCIPDFRLLILTPTDSTDVVKKLKRTGIPSTHFFLAEVRHDEVPDYLSAADFAFALYKPSPAKRALSPVKIGEYWASGLPVLLTEHVGDDSDIIESERAGFSFTPEENGSSLSALRAMHALIVHSNRQQLSDRISRLARKYRSFDQVRTVYETILALP